MRSIPYFIYLSYLHGDVSLEIVRAASYKNKPLINFEPENNSTIRFFFFLQLRILNISCVNLSCSTMYVIHTTHERQTHPSTIVDTNRCRSASQSVCLSKWLIWCNYLRDRLVCLSVCLTCDSLKSNLILNRYSIKRNIYISIYLYVCVCVCISLSLSLSFSLSLSLSLSLSDSQIIKIEFWLK